MYNNVKRQIIYGSEIGVKIEIYTKYTQQIYTNKNEIKSKKGAPKCSIAKKM